MIAAIIQARMGSTRLQGKTLADINGKPLLARIVERSRAITGVDGVVVATTILAEDDPIAALADNMDTAVYRGSETDVLDRYIEAARSAGADIIVRITADDPFKDPDVCALVLREFLSQAPEIDYASNTLEPTWPEGLDVEVFSRDALEKAGREAGKTSEREHVTPYIYNNPQLFRIKQLRHSENLSHLRWTMDYPEDLEFTRQVYKRLDRDGIFTMEDILALLRAEPQLLEINNGFIRNEGYLKAVSEENGE